LATPASRRDFENSEPRIAVLLGCAFPRSFQDRRGIVFLAIPSFTRSRRSMSLTEDRRRD
jgi:hypothetical protein